MDSKPAMDMACAIPKDYCKPEAVDKRLKDYHVTKKNTFLNVDPPLGQSVEGFKYGRRQTSAPPSQSCSSRSSSVHSSSQSSQLDSLPNSKASEAGIRRWADAQDDASGDEEEGSGEAENSTSQSVSGDIQGRGGRKSKRPCKSRRNRYKIFVEKAEAAISRDPHGFDFDAFQLPAFVYEDERLLGKLRFRLSKFQQDVIDGVVTADPSASASAPAREAPQQSAPSSSSTSLQPLAAAPQVRQQLVLPAAASSSWWPGASSAVPQLAAASSQAPSGFMQPPVAPGSGWQQAGWAPAGAQASTWQPPSAGSFVQAPGGMAPRPRRGRSPQGSMKMSL